MVGLEFGAPVDHRLLVDRALHGLRSSGASWRNMLSATIQDDLGFEPTRADPDVCRRPAEKDGFKHCECIFVHVNNLLIHSKELMHWIKRLQAVCDLKDESIGPPELCLGAQIGRTQLPNGTMACQLGTWPQMSV